MNWLFCLILGISYAEEQTKPGAQLPLSGAEREVVDKIINKAPDKPQVPPVAADGKSQAAAETPKADPKDFHQQRLIGEQEPAAKPEPTSVSDSMPWWGIILGLFAMLGLGASLFKRRKQPERSIRVVSRAFLGREGSLAVIETMDGSKNKRRFLVGLNSTGAPSMLADLSPTVVFPKFEEEPRPQPQSRVNIVVGDPIKNGQDLLSEVLSERAKKEDPAPPPPSKKPDSTAVVKPEEAGDPWLSGIEKALGKNG